MKSFLHGLGGGLGRGIGRFVSILAISFLIYFVIGLLDLDIKNDILNKILMLNVSAKEQTTDSFRIYTPYNSQCGSGAVGYCAINSNNTANVRSLNNTYNGVLDGIEFYISYVLNYSYQYTIDIYAMNTDFRNNGLSVYVYGFNNNNPSGMTSLNYNVSFVSKSHIKINLNGNYTYENVAVYMSGNHLTGVNTYGIKKITLTYDDGSTDMSGVIDNQNQNTNDIINNNNNNTQDIIQQVQDLITNNEELTQNIINGMSCPVGPLPLTIQEYSYISNKYLNSSGENITQAGYSISSYVELKPNTEYKVQLLDTLNTPSLCFYRGKSQSQLISCIQYARQNSITFTTPNIAGVVYTLFSLGSRGVSINGPVCNDWQREAQEKLNQIQNETNDLIKDDSVDNNQANSFFNDFDSNDHGLSGIITLPLTTIQSLTSKQCVALQLPIPFTNGSISLPCMSEIYQSKAPALYNMWQVVCYGLIAYWIGTDIFKLVKGFKDPEEDKIEVVDL